MCPLIQRLWTTWENVCNYWIKYSKPKHVYCNIASVSDSVVLTQPLSQIKCPCKSEIRLYKIRINIAGFYCFHSFGVLKSRHGPNSFPSTIILETPNPRPKDTCGDQCANCTYLRDVARHKLTISYNFHEKFYCCKPLDSAQQFNTTSTNLFAWCTTADPAKSTNPICWSHPFPRPNKHKSLAHHRIRPLDVPCWHLSSHISATPNWWVFALLAARRWYLVSFSLPKPSHVQTPNQIQDEEIPRWKENVDKEW